MEPNKRGMIEVSAATYKRMLKAERLARRLRGVVNTSSLYGWVSCDVLDALLNDEKPEVAS